MAKRRLNGEGTIYSRPNGLWVSDVTIGYDSNGKRIRKTLSSMDIEKLKRKMNDLRVKNDMKVLNAPANSSVAEWFDFWLLTYKKPHVRPTTYDMYYNCVNNHIKPKLGKYKLDKLSNLIIQNFINKLSTENGLSTSTLTFHSIRHSFATRLLEKGADIKTVSELLGHKSIQITLDIYSHVSSGLKNNTVSLLDV